MGTHQHEPDDLHRARKFLTSVAEKLELDPSIMEEAMPYLLGMTKHVAHDAVRPAAPLSAFLVGLATGKAGTVDLESVRTHIEKVEEVVRESSLGQS